MKTKPKTLQIPMDSSLSAKWDAVCLYGKNVYSNNAGILDNLIDSYEARKGDRNLIAFADSVVAAVKQHGWDLQLPPSMLNKFKVEDGALWRHVMDKDASKEQASEVYVWVRLK